MLNGDWSQAVDGTMGVHMPCLPLYTGQASRWSKVGWRQMEVVGKLSGATGHGHHHLSKPRRVYSVHPL